MTTRQLSAHALRLLRRAVPRPSDDVGLPPDARTAAPPEGDRQPLAEWVRTAFPAFPDLRIVVTERITDGDTVVARWTASGTHRGPFLGIPPTGRRVEVEGISVGRYAAGTAEDDYVQWDVPGLLRQLGAARPDAVAA